METWRGRRKSIVSNVHLFGAVSSPACANYAIKRTADDNGDEYGTKLPDNLRRNFYVDDLLKSTSTEDLNGGVEGRFPRLVIFDKLIKSD